jgi:hypothetical protein
MLYLTCPLVTLLSLFFQNPPPNRAKLTVQEKIMHSTPYAYFSEHYDVPLTGSINVCEIRLG